MKKLLLIILQCLLCMLLCSCGETYADTLADYYEERLSDYEEIAQYALQNYAAADGSRKTVLLSDITDENLTQSISVAAEDFRYVWIENNSVVFWNDETKTLGLIYSDNVKSEIKAIEEWYNGTGRKKINGNWYLIGQFNSI